MHCAGGGVRHVPFEFGGRLADQGDAHVVDLGSIAAVGGRIVDKGIGRYLALVGMRDENLGRVGRPRSAKRWTRSAALCTRGGGSFPAVGINAITVVALAVR